MFMDSLKAVADGKLSRSPRDANGNAGTDATAQANARANIAAQTGMGQTLRGIDQEQRNAPVTNAQQIVALLSGLPIDLFSGTTEQGTSTGTEVRKSKGVQVGGSISGGPANR